MDSIRTILIKVYRRVIHLIKTHWRIFICNLARWTYWDKYGDTLQLLFNSRKYRWTYWYKEIKPHFEKKQTMSEMPIDVIILAVEKDLEILPYAIDGVRKNVKHPISKIFIISPESKKIQELSSQKGCVFINERSVLDIDPKSLNLIIRGLDRSSWYYQQFLKWSGDKFIGEESYLAVDADTVFVRPQSFGYIGNITLNFSDEYHLPYFDHYKRIIKETVKCPVSFVSHHMLFEKNKLLKLKTRIEEINGCIWYEAILRNLNPNEISGFSDYDTYGQYMFSHYRKNYSLEYWFNLSLTRDKLQDLGRLETLYQEKYKSVSFHSWNQ